MYRPGGERLSNQLERFSVGELSLDETKAIQGLEYSQLPNIFRISSRTLYACIKISNSRSNKIGPGRNEAAKRVRDYFSSLDKSGDLGARPFVKNVEKFKREVVTVEFGQQFYLDGASIIMGREHEGSWNSIILRNKLDGIPDNMSVVSIHKHPNNYPHSLDDIVCILADMETVPRRCLYIVVGPDKLHLLFPNTETPRVELAEVRLQIKEFAQKWINDKSLEYPDLVKEIAAKYRLGYYSSGKSLVLNKE